jgi:hypothetical protein
MKTFMETKRPVGYFFVDLKNQTMEHTKREGGKLARKYKGMREGTKEERKKGRREGGRENRGEV